MRVLILDEAFMSGAYTALGLRRPGCTVRLVAAVGGSGRYHGDGEEWTLAPPPRDGELLGIIDRIATNGAFDVIYPATEPLQHLLWASQGVWTERVFPAFDDWQQRLLSDKRSMSAHVAAMGVIVPEERPAFDDEDVRAGARALEFPLVVKGSAGRGGSATAIATSERDAIAAARRIRARGVTAYLQRYVKGPTFLAGGLFDRGEPLRLYAGEKTIQFPARTGPAAELSSTDDSDLVAAAVQTFRAARVSGIASADFVRDPEGRYHFLELNARPWGSITAARDAGVDLFGPLVQLWRGHAVEPRLEYAIGRRSSIFPLYLLSARFWLRREALGAIRIDGIRALGLARRNPSLAAHLAHRLVRVGLNWT